jgi:hypothetical protein
MVTPLKVVVLGCSGTTTGELTLALDWVKRLRRPVGLTTLVSALVAPAVRWAGPVVTYPARGGFLALSRIKRTLADVDPDLILVADLLLFRGAWLELGVPLDGVVAPYVEDGRVVGLDLYDWDRRQGLLDFHGEAVCASWPGVPQEVGRLMPSPYLAPGPCVPGRGRYAMMEDEGPLSAAEKRCVRDELGLGPGRLVLTTTSGWQHVAQQEKDAAPVARHFPALMLRLLDLAARGAGEVTLAHVGPGPMVVPPDVTGVHYRFLERLPPDRFQALLGAADLLLTSNCIATTAIRAACRRVPVASLFLGAAVATPPPCDNGSPPARALDTYLRATCPTYPFHVWPLGLHRGMESIFEDNPFSALQERLDLLRPEAVVEGLHRLLVDGGRADALRGVQADYFRLLGSTLGSPDDALTAALRLP